MNKNELTMSTNLSNKISPEWITQAEAARIRGVSRQAINKLIKKGRIKSMQIATVTFVDKNEIKNFLAHTSGRPKKAKNE